MTGEKDSKIIAITQKESNTYLSCFKACDMCVHETVQVLSGKIKYRVNLKTHNSIC